MSVFAHKIKLRSVFFMVRLLDHCWNKIMMKAVILCAFGQDMGSMQCSSLKRAAHEMAILLWAQGGTASVTLVRFPNHPQGRGGLVP